MNTAETESQLEFQKTLKLTKLRRKCQVFRVRAAVGYTVRSKLNMVKPTGRWILYHVYGYLKYTTVLTLSC